LRAVLIAISDRPGFTPEGGAKAPVGRPLVLRQLDFALACGCEEVLALGDPDSPEVTMLARAARSRGAIVRMLGDAHGLLGVLNTADELLVLAADILPESPLAVKVLSVGPGVLVLPADVAVPAGFERVDRDLAWAGAAVLPGTLVERLAELPRDSDAPAALLRIALQARVPERMLADTVLPDGSWLMADSGVVPLQADGWRRQQLATAEPFDGTGRLAQFVIRRWPTYVRPNRRTIGALYAGGVLALVAAVILAWYGFPAAGFALLAPSALASAVAQRLQEIDAGPFARRKERSRGRAILSWSLDGALGLCGALAIGGAWLGRVFPPLVLIIALRGRPAAQRPRALAMLGDRMALAIVLAIATALDVAEPAIMVLALLFLLGDRMTPADR